MTDHDAPTPGDDFEQRARHAGRALREAPPADGLRRISSARRNRRIAQVGGALAVVALGIGGVVAIATRGRDGNIATAPTVPSTMPATAPITTPAPQPATPPTAPATTPGTAPAPSVAPDPFSQATLVAATADGILLGLPDGSWIPTPFTEPAEGPAYLAGPYVVHQPDQIERWNLTVAPIRLVTQDGVAEWTPPGPEKSDDGRLRYRVLDAGIVDGAPTMLVSQTDDGMPDTADVRLLLVDLTDGHVRDLGSFGGWEEGVPAARLAGGRIVALRTAEVLTTLVAIEFDGRISAAQELTPDVGWNLSLGTDGTAYAFHTAWDDGNWSLESVALLMTDLTTLPMSFALPTDFEEVTGGCYFPDFTSVQLWCHGPAGPASVHISDSTVWAPDDGRPDGVVTRRIGELPAGDPPPAAIPTVWVGGKLAGHYETDGTFVAWDAGDLPAGVLGATFEVGGIDGYRYTVTATDDSCWSPYLTPSPDVWGVLATANAPVLAVAAERSLHPDELATALTELGVEGTPTVSLALPSGTTGTSQRLVLLDGWNSEFQFPTWIAVWDADTDEFTVLEGDLDPQQALDIGLPTGEFVDLDGDGAWEVVYAVGDAWLVHEYETGDLVASGDAHPCPDVSSDPTNPTNPETLTVVQALLGEWAFEPDGDPVVWVSSDGYSMTWLMGSCGLAVSDLGDRLGLSGWPERPGDCAAGATPEVAALVEALGGGAAVGLAPDRREVLVDLFDGSQVALVPVGPVPDTIDLARGALLGNYVGAHVHVEDLLATVSAQFGEPTSDSGWYITPPNPDPEAPDCLASMDTRDVAWGDLVVRLWPDPLDDQMATLWNVTLGGVAAAADPTGLVTAEGFSIGSPVADLGAYYGDALSWIDGPDGRPQASVLPDARPLAGYGNHITFETNRETITSITLQKNFC